MIIDKYYFWNKVEKRRSRRRDVYCIREFEICSMELGIAAFFESLSDSAKMGIK